MINGGKFLMASHVEIIRNFINVNKLVPIERQAAKTAGKKTSSSYEGLYWWMKYGGMLVPHLHFEGNVYILNEVQWGSFSKSLVKDFQKKLARANSISFQNALDISNTIDGML